MRTAYTRRGFLTITAAAALAASGAAMFGCGSDKAGSEPKADEGSEETKNQEEQKAPEPGSSEENPIDIKLGDTIRVDDAALTIESNDGFNDEMRGTDPTYSLKLDSQKVALLVRCSLYYEGKSEVNPATRITAQVTFDGGYKYTASVEDTEKLFGHISPLETRGITLCAQVPDNITGQLTDPVLIIRVAKRFDPADKSSEGVYYRCPLS